MEAIRATFERLPEPKQLVVLDGAAHAQFLFQDATAGEQVMAAILRFIEEAPPPATFAKKILSSGRGYGNLRAWPKLTSSW